MTCFLLGDYKDGKYNCVVTSTTFNLAKEAFLHVAAAEVSAATFHLLFMEDIHWESPSFWVLCCSNQSRSKDPVFVTICQGHCIQNSESLLILFLKHTYAHIAEDYVYDASC